MSIRRAATQLHKAWRCLKTLLLGDDHLRRSFVKQYDLVVKGLKVPELGLGTGRTIGLEDPVGVPHHPLGEVSFTSVGFAFDNKEFIAGTEFHRTDFGTPSLFRSSLMAELCRRLTG